MVVGLSNFNPNTWHLPKRIIRIETIETLNVLILGTVDPQSPAAAGASPFNSLVPQGSKVLRYSLLRVSFPYLERSYAYLLWELLVKLEKALLGTIFKKPDVTEVLMLLLVLLVMMVLLL